jgi:quercetin dioxygenase-like cupin family protein
MKGGHKMSKHNQVEVGNWYDSEKYFSLKPGNPKGVKRYSFTGSKVSVSLNFIGKGLPNVGEHAHPHEQCLMVPQGDGDALIDGKRYPTEEGFFAIIPPNMPHGYDCEKATVPCWNLDVFNPARLEFLKENYYNLLAQGKDPMKEMITEE